MGNTVSGYEECGEEPVLPRDIFSNRFSYYIVTNKITSGFIFCEAFLVAVLVLLNIHNLFALVLILIFGSLFMYFTGFIAWLLTNKLTEANEMILLKEVTTARPGLNMKKWCLIAKKLNPRIFGNDPSATPYFFYDGNACVYYFKRRFLKPRIGRERQKAVTPQQLNSNLLQSTPAAYGQLNPFIEEAVNVYQESLTAYWREMMNDNV